MNHINRRQFLTLASATCGALLLPRFSFGRALMAEKQKTQPHFFLEILLPGGVDTSYFFDARSLAMTAAGKIQNYLGQEPIPYEGVNGTSCLRSPLTDPLLPLLPRIAVVNGVFMIPSFDGHDQNLNFLVTGSPFGGESFIPHLNQRSTLSDPSPLDGLLNGVSYADASNHGGMVPLDPASLALLKNKLGSTPDTETSDLSRFVRSRLVANATGEGSFSATTREMLRSFDSTHALREKIQGLRSPDSSLSADRQFVQLLNGTFQAGMARSALWTINDTFDTHSGEQAARQPVMFKNTVARFREILNAMIETPFDSQHSMLDVTTVMISSEFSRSMRQSGFTVDKTGTDHNSVSNMFLFAGKGIRGGQVIGATDYKSAEENLSRFHLSFDPEKIKAVGRPFDFVSGKPTQAMPEKYDPAQFLTVGSIVNTMYELFGVPASSYRKHERSDAGAPVLKHLIAM